MTADQTVGLAHQPDPRTYDCRGCGQAWPCAPARDYLTATSDRVSLLLRMAMELEEASLVLASAEDLYTRFVGWAR